MTFLHWLPALSTTALLTTCLWLGRNLISTRLVKSVEHEFNGKLETLKADIRAKAAEIAILRNGVMTALTSRQVAVDKRRLEAVDQLWAAAISLGPARAISTWMASIKFEAAAEQAELNPKLRQLFEMLGTDFDIKALGASEAQRARPYVSAMAWATYSAILTVAVHAVMRWHILKGGLGKEDFADIKSINNLLKTALPHQKEYIDRNGPSGYNLLLGELEEKLLSELRSMLSGEAINTTNLKQAADILRQSEELLK